VPVGNRSETMKIARRARSWLIANAVLPHDAESLSDLLTALIGVYICDSLEGVRARPSSVRVGRLLSEYLETSGISLEPDTYGTSRLLLAHYILSSYGFPPGALSITARDTATAIDSTRGPLPTEYNTVLLLLRRLKLTDREPKAKKLTQSDIGDGALEILMAERDELRQICEQISDASLYGTATVPGSGETRRRLAQALPPMTLQRLRMYDLELGTMLLRSLAYLKIQRNDVMKTGLGFLELQQRTDGAFGYFAYEIHRGGDVPDAVVVRRWYLTITAACLWTIAELRVPGFKLLPVSPIR
jgi:hypothetical protein